MTPEERELVRGLFDRLSQLERAPRDSEAEQLIREGLSRAPNATYALVQNVLLQDEALRAANARIEELQDQLANARPPEPRRDESFLGQARGKWNTGAVLGSPGYEDDRGHSNRPGGLPPSYGGGSDRPMGVPPGFGGSRGYPGDYGEPPMGREPEGAPWSGRGGPQGGPQGPQGPAGPGGGFLGTAAAIAASVIGGGLLMGGIKSALGGGSEGANPGSGQAGGKSPFADAFSQLTGSKESGGQGSGGDLARDAGVGDVGQGGRQGAWNDQSAAQNEPAAQGDNEGYVEDTEDYETDFEDDGSFEDEI